MAAPRHVLNGHRFPRGSKPSAKVADLAGESRIVIGIEQKHGTRNLRLAGPRVKLGEKRSRWRECSDKWFLDRRRVLNRRVDGGRERDARRDAPLIFGDE